VFGTLAAVVFIQAFLIEGLRFLGDWRNLLFGALIVLAMNVRPGGLLDAKALGADLSALRHLVDGLRSGHAGRWAIGRLEEVRAELRRRIAKWRGLPGA
jgi:hypothetical protein